MTYWVVLVGFGSVGASEEEKILKVRSAYS